MKLVVHFFEICKDVEFIQPLNIENNYLLVTLSCLSPDFTVLYFLYLVFANFKSTAKYT